MNNNLPFEHAQVSAQVVVLVMWQIATYLSRMCRILLCYQSCIIAAWNLIKAMVLDSLPQFLHVILCLYERHCDPIHTCSAGKLDVLLVLERKSGRNWHPTGGGVDVTCIYIHQLPVVKSTQMTSLLRIVREANQQKLYTVSKLVGCWPKPCSYTWLCSFKIQNQKSNLSTLRNLTRIDVDQRCDMLWPSVWTLCPCRWSET